MDQVKNYGAHALSYIVSALTVVAGTNPALLPPSWLPYIGVAGLLLTGAHGQAVGPGAPKAPPAAVLKVLAVFMLGTMLAASMAACTTTPTAREQSAVAVAINIAAGRAIQREDADPKVWKARAVEYKAVAVQLQTVNDGGTATVATLVGEVQPLIVKLGPADQLAARSLLAALTPYLQEQANANPNLNVARERLSYILATFVTACEAYGA